MKPVRATQEPWMGDVIDSRDIVSVVSRAHREERRERLFALWSFIFAAILTAIIVLLSGCAGPLDGAVKASNAAQVSLVSAARGIADLHSAERDRAVNEASSPDEARKASAIVHARFRKVWDAYAQARAIQIAAEATIRAEQAAEAAGQTRDVGDVLVAAARLSAAMAALGQAATLLGLPDPLTIGGVK